MCCKVKRRAIWKKSVIGLGGLAVLLLFLLSVGPQLKLAGNSMGQMLKQTFAAELEEAIYQQFIPSFSLAQEKRREGIWFADGQLAHMIPLYGYTMKQRENELKEAAFLSLEEIQPAENREDPEAQQEDKLATPEENTVENAAENEQENSLEELLKAENEAVLLAREAEEALNKTFVPHTVQTQIKIEEFADYEKLVRKFYTIDANTMAGSDQLDITKLLSYDMRLSDGEESGNAENAPRILIYHTHSQEGFADSVPGDKTTTIMGVGERLAQLLYEEYGYQVLHHEGQYDVTSRDDAYSASLPALEQILAENPSIEVIIDLHRDQMAEGTKLVMDLDGRPTARFMFFNGLSRTRKTGNISYLYNEYQEENLAFSFQMKLAAEEYYPGLTRKNYLKGYRYNMHLRPRTLLIELGAQNNTLEEAMNACEPLAHILHMVLSGQ